MCLLRRCLFYVDVLLFRCVLRRCFCYVCGFAFCYVFVLVVCLFTYVLLTVVLFHVYVFVSRRCVYLGDILLKWFVLFYVGVVFT